MLTNAKVSRSRTSSWLIILQNAPQCAGCCIICSIRDKTGYRKLCL